MPGTIRARGTRVLQAQPDDAFAHPAARTGGTEVEELRTEYSKTYMCDDGSLLSQVYSEPVHRRDAAGMLHPIETDQYWACFTRDQEAWDGECLTS